MVTGLPRILSLRLPLRTSAGSALMMLTTRGREPGLLLHMPSGGEGPHETAEETMSDLKEEQVSL